MRQLDSDSTQSLSDMVTCSLSHPLQRKEKKSTKQTESNMTKHDPTSSIGTCRNIWFMVKGGKIENIGSSCRGQWAWWAPPWQTKEKKTTLAQRLGFLAQLRSTQNSQKGTKVHFFSSIVSQYGALCPSYFCTSMPCSSIPKEQCKVRVCSGRWCTFAKMGKEKWKP